jgi:hypothetical protein
MAHTVPPRAASFALSRTQAVACFGHSLLRAPRQLWKSATSKRGIRRKTLLFEWRNCNFADYEKTEVKVLLAETRSGARVTVMHRG